MWWLAREVDCRVILLESEKFKEIAFYSGKNKTVEANGNEILKIFHWLTGTREGRKRQRERTTRSE